MGDSLPQPDRLLPLNRVRKPEPAKANLTVNFVHNGGRLLRLAVARTGMSHKEAMDALGIEHKSEFSQMLDGTRKIWVHQMLRPEAAAIWKELLIIAACEAGCEVERVIRIKEKSA